MKKKTFRIIMLILIFLGIGGAIFWIYSGQSLPMLPNPSAASTPTAGTSAEAATTVQEGESSPEAGLATPAPVTSSIETVLVLVGDNITSLDPYRMVRVHPDESIASHIWDTLTWLNDDLQIEPHLAESWRLVNNLTWEFKLRQGIEFHNGEPLNAGAVRFSIERARAMPDSTETFAEDVNLQNVEVIDEYTVRVTTGEPMANVPYHLAFLEILPPVYYAETNPNQLATQPVGSGPYRVEGWNQGQELVLEATPDYWKGTPIISSLVFQVVPGIEERLAILQNEEAVLITDLPPTRPEQWDIPGSKLETIETTQRMFVGFHIEQDSPLANNQVRQALNYGVNVDQIVDDLLEGYGERYGSWVNPPHNNPDLAPWPYDPDLARELLAEAGYQEGFTTTLLVPAEVYDQGVAVANAVAEQLNEIGVTVSVKTVDWPVYARTLTSGNPEPLFLLGLNSRGNDLEDVKNMSASFAFNPTNWQDSQFEEHLKNARGQFSEASRTRLLLQAQKIAYDAAPWLWLWRTHKFYGVSEGLDWQPRRDGLVHLYVSAVRPD